MTIYEFCEKYDIVQLGDTDNIIFNIIEIAYMLKNCTVEEIQQIIAEMRNLN